MDYAVRINLKTSGEDRQKLIDFCLNEKDQYLAIGWSCVYTEESPIKSYDDYYYAVSKYYKKDNKKINPVHNIFWYAEKNDLFWTRDLDGFYWICRVKDKAKQYYNKDMDIGALLPIEAYKYSMTVPGQIKASFNLRNGGTAARIKDSIITEFSKYIFNELSGRHHYDYEKSTGDFLMNLPDFDLEELVISYLQIKENYYVLSNSIANKSTTIKIECELMSRDPANPKKAVVQVKGGENRTLYALEYQSFSDSGYITYLFAPHIENIEKAKNVIAIQRDDLIEFYNEYKSILPESITEWECLIP